MPESRVVDAALETFEAHITALAATSPGPGFHGDHFRAIAGQLAQAALNIFTTVQAETEVERRVADDKLAQARAVRAGLEQTLMQIALESTAPKATVKRMAELARSKLPPDAIAALPVHAA